MTTAYKKLSSNIVTLLLSLIISIQIGTHANAAPRKKKSRKTCRQTLVSLSAETTQEERTKGEELETTNEDLNTLISTLISKGEKLLGKPYRARGIAPWVLDCSGYVCYLYKQLGISLPRTSAALSTYTERVEEPQAGDLIFFKGRNASAKRVGHVALVVSNNNGDPIIMHSTTSRGIVKHRLSKVAYFSKRYLFAGRLPQIAEMLREDDSCDNT